MRIRTMKTCIKDGFKGIFRNGLMSLASIGTIAACLIILGITYCLVMNVQYFAGNLEGNLGMVAFLQAGVTEEQALELEQKLNEREDVDHTRYVSSDEAWQDFKQELLGDTADDLNDALMGELDSDNPLQNAANIEVYPVQAEDQQTIVEFLNQQEIVRKVSYSADASQALASFGKLVTYVGIALILFLIFIALLLIANTIKLSVYIRRNEINIMKYIGATDGFVRLPFIVEGIFIGCLGAILPIVIVYFGYDSLVGLLNSRFSAITTLVNFLSVNEIMRGLLPIFLVLSVLVGAVGSMISIRKHLKV